MKIEEFSIVENLSLVCLAFILAFLILPRWIEMQSWKLATEVNSMVGFFAASIAVSHSKWLKSEKPMQILFDYDSVLNLRYLKMNSFGWPVALIEKISVDQEFDQHCEKMWDIFVVEKLFDQSEFEVVTKETMGNISKRCQYFVDDEFLIDYQSKEGTVILSKES